MNVDIKELSQISDRLEALEKDEVLYVNREGMREYVIMPIEYYESIEDVLALLNSPMTGAQVRIADPGDLELSYDEYERIKNQIMEAVEKTWRPKAEKLN